MHLLLTDRLTCPRCGPGFGLILLADRLVERRVQEGKLGCPNCRDSFSVQGGFADLRAPPRGPLGDGRAGEPAADDAPEAQRLVALLGIVRGPGTVALVGRPARFAAGVARAVDDIDVVAVDPDARRWPERRSVSRLAADPGLPFFGATLRGAVVDGRIGRAAIYEAARVVAPRCRLVVTDAGGDAREVVVAAGLEVLAEEGGTVVATRG